jgi:hypothetical protein
VKVRDLIAALQKEDPDAVIMSFGPSPGEDKAAWHEARRVSRGTTSNSRDDWRRDSDVERAPDLYNALPHRAIEVH